MKSSDAPTVQTRARNSLARSVFAVLKQRPFLRECSIFLLFIGLAAVMTWPWLSPPLNTISDPGDPYLLAYTLWWDFHQTFHDPLHLFDANIFYPYRNTLAFTEHCYGIALPFFPLFALGARPLTVHTLATFFAFVFSGYGAFRLARTLTNSSGAGWIAGIAFAFVPYRFEHLPHLPYIFAGWIPLLLEALVLFVRARTWRRASWLGLAFFMNALTCITWFVLTLIPLAFSAAFLLWWHTAWQDRRLWWRGAVALGLATLALLPFMLPYRSVAEVYGFVRSGTEAQFYSGDAINWLVASPHNRLWAALGLAIPTAEGTLFPGLLILLLAFAPLFLFKSHPANAPAIVSRPDFARRRKRLLVFLDVVAALALIVALLVASYGTIRLRLFGLELFRASHPARALFVLFAALGTRLLLTRSLLIRDVLRLRLSLRTRGGERFEALVLGMIWAIIGFVGTFGMNFFVYRFLFEGVWLFKSQRVPMRWAMICYLGLSLLAGLGASSIARAIARRAPTLFALGRIQIPRTTLGVAVLTLLAILLLGELWAAPLNHVRGRTHPDEVTLRLKATPMAGGIVELPITGWSIYERMIRAADHGKPLITATSGFIPPIMKRIGSLTRQRPVPHEFLDLLESIPTSYLVIHLSSMTPAEIENLNPTLRAGVDEKRLRFLRRYHDNGGVQDLYAVTKIEPTAVAEAPVPPQ